MVTMCVGQLLWNYEVQGLGDNHNLSFLLGNEVIKNRIILKSMV